MNLCQKISPKSVELVILGYCLIPMQSFIKTGSLDFEYFKKTLNAYNSIPINKSGHFDRETQLYYTCFLHGK